MVEQQRTEASKFFASTCPSRAAMQATWNHVAVAGVLGANRGIHGQDSAVKVADADNNFLHERGIIGKNRGHERAAPAANHGDKVFRAVISHQGHHRAKHLDVVNIFGSKPIIAGEERGLNESRLLRIRVDGFEAIISAKYH